MEGSEKILDGYSDMEKGAYLSAIASIATADREASEEEMQYLQTLADAAGLSDEQKEAVVKAATDESGADLQNSLDILKKSDLKYSLIADLITFSKADGEYSSSEEDSVQKIGQYLGVDQQQFSLLDQFAQKTSEQQQAPQQGGVQNMLGLGGLGDKMQSAGINTSSLLKGLLAVAAPMLLSRMFNRNSGRATTTGGGGLGGMLGGMLGGGGLGGTGGGGLGSLIGMLSGGRGFGGAGGLLGKVLGGRF